MLLVPDQHMGDIYRPTSCRTDAGDALFFAHGFNSTSVRSSPGGRRRGDGGAQGPGHLRPAHGTGVPAPAVPPGRHGKAHDLGLSYAWGIGGTRAGVLGTTFAEETETDLFGEQVILCGGVASLIKASFDTLVEAGYQPESAYFETLHELKLIVDLLYEGGLSWMRYSVSDTAEYGDYTRGNRIVTDETRAEMRRILDEVRSGAFAREWMAQARGCALPLGEPCRRAQQPIEQVGRQLRQMMPFLTPQDAP